MDPVYRWLHKEPGPKLLRAALATFGTAEIPGTKSNSVILAWAKELGIAYAADSTPWCGLAMAKWVSDAGYTPVDQPLWALNWARFGTPVAAADGPVDVISLADVLVFKRPLPGGGTAGHVGLYVGEDEDAFHTLGGNQSDKVCIQRVAKPRLVAARRSPWRVAQPKNVRPIRLARTGVLSVNEA